MIASWGGLDGPIGEPDEVNDLFNDIITWDSAKEYFFVKNSPGACNAADINLDALCSQIAYVSMLRKDLFNTFFSNDGNYGHVGRPGLVLKPSYWKKEGVPSGEERVHFKQGWFIDSWPDYRFVNVYNSSDLTAIDRFRGLNYEASGYRTSINLQYLAQLDMIPEDVAHEAADVEPPTFCIGDSNPQYTSFQMRGDIDQQAFKEYYINVMNKSVGAFEGFTDGGKRGGGNSTGINVNFLQGFLDFDTFGLEPGLDALAELRTTYFKEKLFENSPNGPPFGNEVELDVFPWKTEPPKAERVYGENFTSHMIPFNAVGAVTLMHQGPKWSFATRPQPPHMSSQSTWSVDPEYYFLYMGFRVLFDGIVASLDLGTGPPEKLEVSNINGTNFAGAELVANIDAWANGKTRVSGTEVFSSWQDLYANETGPYFEVSMSQLPADAEGGMTYYRVNAVTDIVDAHSLQVAPGYGVWVSASSEAVEGIQITGSPGDDDLYGGPGDDRLVAFSATDRLTGGEGSDTFVVTESVRRAIIMDLEVSDVLVIEGCRQAENVSISSNFWPGVLPEPGTPIYEFRGGDNYTSVSLPGRPNLLQLWRVDPDSLLVEVDFDQPACHLSVKN